MSQIDINSMLSQMRQLSTQVRMPETSFARAANAAQGEDFGALLRQSIIAVGQTQMEAGRLAASFERGDEGADLGRTMVAVQKAGLSLSALTEVRNRMVDAYKDIMNMPV
ncbi:flagellar hook-basal body complex protein FliE [Dyella subtropica]|uniref:flagellar hook-basal body complex protein FliE n=1 Tax=Dyella subtropica TaxID=2992127 RepID=UPI00225A356B|nr:flagellar hook-basal body complex protein FliE [Dyella subtropica]